jgi:hypothetical protein
VVETVATVVELGLTISADLASFGEAEQASLKTTLELELGCFPPACLLELRLSASSVAVSAILTIPDTGPGNSSATASSITTAATTLVQQPPEALSSSLGVTVVSAAPVAVASGVAVPIAVAPPPPSPPPSPPSPPPSPAPSPPPLPPSSPVQGSSDSLDSGANGGAAVTSSGAIYAAIGAGVALSLSALLAWRWRRGLQRAAAPVPANGGARAASSTHERTKDLVWATSSIVADSPFSCDGSSGPSPLQGTRTSTIGKLERSLSSRGSSNNTAGSGYHHRRSHRESFGFVEGDWASPLSEASHSPPGRASRLSISLDSAGREDDAAEELSNTDRARLAMQRRRLSRAASEGRRRGTTDMPPSLRRASTSTILPVEARLPAPGRRMSTLRPGTVEYDRQCGAVSYGTNVSGRQEHGGRDCSEGAAGNAPVAMPNVGRQAQQAAGRDDPPSPAQRVPLHGAWAGRAGGGAGAASECEQMADLTDAIGASSDVVDVEVYVDTTSSTSRPSRSSSQRSSGRASTGEADGSTSASGGRRKRISSASGRQSGGDSSRAKVEEFARV